MTGPAGAGTGAQGRYPDGLTAQEVRTSPGLWEPGRDTQQGTGLPTMPPARVTPVLSVGTYRIKQLEKLFPDGVEKGDCYHAWGTCCTNPVILVRHVDGDTVGLIPVLLRGIEAPTGDGSRCEEGAELHVEPALRVFRDGRRPHHTLLHPSQRQGTSLPVGPRNPGTSPACLTSTLAWIHHPARHQLKKQEVRRTGCGLWPRGAGEAEGSENQGPRLLQPGVPPWIWAAAPYSWPLLSF